MTSRVLAQVRQSPSQPWQDRFWVHVERPEDKSFASKAARFLLQCWDVFSIHLGIDHATIYRNGTVDIYLCRGGKPGGEQRIDQIRESNRWIRINTIYLYGIDKLGTPTETMRELSHEYGHAVLPAVGGFQSPEDWGNGYLGEKLAMSWLAAKPEPQWNVDDFLGSRQEDTKAWVKQNALPLRDRVATMGPQAAGSQATGPKAMDAYVGLGLYAAEILPPELSRQALLFMEGPSKDVWKLFETLLAEESRIPLYFDAFGAGEKIWIPLPKGFRAKGAKVIKADRGWAHVVLETKRPEIYRP